MRKPAQTGNRLETLNLNCILKNVNNPLDIKERQLYRGRRHEQRVGVKRYAKSENSILARVPPNDVTSRPRVFSSIVSYIFNHQTLYTVSRRGFKCSIKQVYKRTYSRM